MTNLKSKIAGYMCRVTLLMVVFLLLCSGALQIFNEQKHAREGAEEIFGQVEHVLESNREELEEVLADYHKASLVCAENVAYIIGLDSDKLKSRIDMLRVAHAVGVDEINVFDENGVIISGTNPDYYGLSMSDGEQVSFFAPLLEDKTLRLVQDITPNTIEGKSMQYSALWSFDRQYIIQVGMKPVNVYKVTEKNELSHIFSLLKADAGIDLYAADPETGEILGATQPDKVGMTLGDLGISLDSARSGEGFHYTADGVGRYSVFTDIDGKLIGYAVRHSKLYESVVENMLILAAGLLLVAAMLVAAVTRYMQKKVINNISRVNESLRQITEGDLERSVGITETIEFSELSSHINEMVRTLLAGTDKMSYVLDHSDLNIGVYEYNTKMKMVRYTERVPGMLLLTDKKGKAPASVERDKFREYIDKIRENTLQDEDGVYEIVSGGSHRYIRIEESVDNNDTTGIIVDVTDQVDRRRVIEAERDIDKLTGILNRRGLDNALRKLLDNEKELGCAALVMIDADGLKKVNDNYGHENGDIYIKGLADTLTSFGQEKCRKFLVSRNGGDEFVLFIYGCGSDDELGQSLEAIPGIQDQRELLLTNGETVTLRFSAGSCVYTPDIGYDEMFKLADDRMYENKRERKKAQALAGAS